jgi:hypothetical protein
MEYFGGKNAGSAGNEDRERLKPDGISQSSGFLMRASENIVPERPVLFCVAMLLIGTEAEPGR